MASLPWSEVGEPTMDLLRRGARATILALGEDNETSRADRICLDLLSRGVRCRDNRMLTDC